MRIYRHRRTGREARRLSDLVSGCGAAELAPCRKFFAGYGQVAGIGDAAPFSGVSQRMTGLERPVVIEGTGGLRSALEVELDLLPVELHVAVSGGIDCWVVAALAKRRGHRVTAWYLESRVEGYCEREAAFRMAAALRIRMEAIVCREADFHGALPRFIAATEYPVYNLHPVSKLLLAEGLRRNGVTSVISGDGADQVFRWDRECDLLPLTFDCFESRGVQLIAPFLSERVRRSVTHPFANKEPLRELAAEIGVPDVPKRPARFPCDSRAVLAESAGILFQRLGVPLPCAVLQG